MCVPFSVFCKFPTNLLPVASHEISPVHTHTHVFITCTPHAIPSEVLLFKCSCLTSVFITDDDPWIEMFYQILMFLCYGKSYHDPTSNNNYNIDVANNLYINLVLS